MSTANELLEPETTSSTAVVSVSREGASTITLLEPVEEIHDEIDLTIAAPPLTRVATIDLSGFGTTIELGTTSRNGELLRLSLGDRSVHLLDASHPFIGDIVAMEIDAVSAGRDRAEFDAWLTDLTGVTFAVVADAPIEMPLTLKSIRSMARITSHPRCDRGLRELATLLGRNPEDVINDFRERSGFADLHGLVDLTTLSIAPAGATSARQYAVELGNLIDAVGTVLMVMAGRGLATVLTTSIERIEQRWLLGAGWPLADGLDGDLAEVLLGSRSRAGRAIPSWLRMHGLWGSVAAQRTPSMANVASHLHRNRIDLGSCIPRARTGR